MVVKYIIGHWTAGNHKPCQLDLDSYQLLIDGEGERHKGKPVGKTASTGGMNSITYNISCCGGLFTSPITKAQQEAFFKACAEKIKEYGLTVNDFYTHAEIGWMCKENTIQKLVTYKRLFYTIIAIYILHFMFFTHNYFTNYNQKLAQNYLFSFSYGIKDALQKAEELHHKTNKSIYILGEPYIYPKVLFLNKISLKILLRKPLVTRR